MRILTCIATAALLAAGLSAAEPNTLSPEEEAAGFRLLFDGESTEAWTKWGGGELPGGWVVVDGILHRQGGGGDIATAETFKDFELRLEWKISPGGNSGVFYRSVTGNGAGYKTGHEMQVLDNDKHGDGKNPKTSAGSAYALYPPSEDVTRPVGEWNEVRLVVDGQQVEHWLNGTRIVSFEIGSDDWNERLSNSKFKDWEGFGVQPEGHIVLQDHGNPVWFRSIRIRELGAE